MEKFIKKLIWLLFGVLITYVVAASVASGIFNPACFYDMGNVDEITPDVLQLDGNGFVYQSADDEFLTVTEDAAFKILGITSKKWNHMILDIDNIKTEKINIHLTAYDREWNALGSQDLELENGKNFIDYTLPKCNFITVEIYNQIGQQIMFRQMQFREKLLVPDKKNAVISAGIIFVLYLLLTAAYLFLRKKGKITFRKNGFIIFDKIQKGYLKLQYRAALLLYELFGKKKIPGRRFLRITSLGIWIFTEIIMRGMGLRSRMIPFHYIMAVIVLLIFVITALERKPHYTDMKWNPMLFFSWFSLNVIMTVSGILVEKKWPWIGILFLTIFGLFYFVWNDMERPRVVLADIGIALKSVFWLTTLISIAAREYIPNQPYSGIYKNQNVFTSFLIMILAVNLTQICNIFRENKYRMVKNFSLCAETCTIFFLLYRTESRGGWLTCFILMMVFFVHFIKLSVKRKNWRAFLIIQVIVLIIPVFVIFEWTYTQVQKISPFSIKYQVAQEEEDIYAGDFKLDTSEVVYAGEETHLIKSLKSKTFGAFTSGRTVIWKTYIKNFNLFGHYNKEYIGGLSIHSHNAFIYMIYLYGILSIIPYCVMWLMLFNRAILFMKSRAFYSFLPMALMTGFFVQAMTDTLEEPFSMESWIIAYIVIGILFARKRREG